MLETSTNCFAPPPKKKNNAIKLVVKEQFLKQTFKSIISHFGGD